MKPTEYDWELLIFCQKISHAVRKSDNLRLPTKPEQALKAMSGKLRSERKGGAA
jgi:hypothetical protein